MAFLDSYICHKIIPRKLRILVNIVSLVEVLHLGWIPWWFMILSMMAGPLGRESRYRTFRKAFTKFLVTYSLVYSSRCVPFRGGFSSRRDMFWTCFSLWPNVIGALSIYYLGSIGHLSTRIIIWSICNIIFGNRNSFLNIW